MGARSVRPGWPSMTEKDISDPKQAGITGGIKLHHNSEIHFPSTDCVMRKNFFGAAVEPSWVFFVVLIIWTPGIKTEVLC